MIPLLVLTFGVMVIGVFGYILFLRKSGDTETVFAATEVVAREGVNFRTGQNGNFFVGGAGLQRAAPGHSLSARNKVGHGRSYERQALANGFD